MTSTQKLVWSIVGIVAILLIGAGFYFSSKTAEVTPVVGENEEDAIAPVTLDVKHQYINGTHTILGVVDLPTPCHSLQASQTLNKDATVATIALQSTSTAEVCAQVISPKTFKTQFTGPINMDIVATFNGKSLNLNIFEVPANADIHTFEIYTKG